MQRARRIPSDGEVSRAAELLNEIPSAGREWNTPQGAAFIAYTEELSRRDVPLAWLAETLGLEPGHLYTIMTRHRQSA